MTVFTYHTHRTIEIVADTEEEASGLVQAELHPDEYILSWEQEKEETADEPVSGKVDLLARMQRAAADLGLVPELAEFLGSINDEPEPEQLEFVNHYTCPRCRHVWADRWTATCDDDCPNCGLRHISPTHSEDA